MKKLVLASIIALATTTASALEVGVHSSRDYSGNVDRNSTGITLSENYGKIGVTGGFERFTKGTSDQDRYSLAVGYDIAKVGTVTITPKLGVALLQNQVGEDGFAFTAGIGAKLPITKQVSLNLDVARQNAQDRVGQFDGNIATFGLGYRF